MIKNMLSGAFLLTIALCAASASAAGPCPHQRTRERCDGYPTGECFWDDTDDRCEPRQDPVGRCGEIDDVQECMSIPKCFWDDTDERCENR